MRKQALAKLLETAHGSLLFNEHFDEDGAIVFREAYKVGCQGIVSRRLSSLSPS